MIGNPLQLMQTLMSNRNPMAMLQQMAGEDPLMQRALQMGNGKDVNALQAVARNLAKQRGMSDEQFNGFIAQFGMTK